MNAPRFAVAVALLALGLAAIVTAAAVWAWDAWGPTGAGVVLAALGLVLVAVAGLAIRVDEPAAPR